MVSPSFQHPAGAHSACPVPKGACLPGSPSWQPDYKKLKSPNAPQNGAKNQALSFSVKKHLEKYLHNTAGPAGSGPFLPNPP